MSQNKMPPGPRAAAPQNHKPSSTPKSAESQEKWPPHLLQASGFRPNHQAKDDKPGRRGWMVFALLGVTIVGGGLAWSAVNGQSPSKALRVSIVSEAAKPQSAATKEQQKLARADASTLSRVLSDLRILQSAFANLQGQISNLPARSSIDAMGKKANGMERSLVAVTAKVRAVQKGHVKTIADLKSKVAAVEAKGQQTIGALEARIAKLEKAWAGRTAVASVNSSRIERSARSQAASAKKRGRSKSAFGYVLREVHRGVAVVENRAGEFIEVYPGMNVPGAGRVRSIRRRGGRWVVVTSRGTIDSRPY